MTDPLVIAGTSFSSRLIAGTARYPNQQVMLDALEASGAELVTASIRRISLEGYSGSLVELLGDRYHILPNTAGCVTARDAILTAELAREDDVSSLLTGQTCEVWSPYDAHEAAAVLLRVLEAEGGRS